MTIRKGECNPQAELAAAILDAFNAREESYDKKAADAATTKVAAKNAKLSEQERLTPVWQWIDYSQFYTKTLRQACEEIAGDLAEPVYLLLTYAPNDAQEWAEGVLGIKHPPRDEDMEEPEPKTPL